MLICCLIVVIVGTSTWVTPTPPSSAMNSGIKLFVLKDRYLCMVQLYHTDLGGPGVRQPRFFDHLANFFDHDHGLNFNVIVVKWSKILTMTIVKIQIFHGQNIHFIMAIGKITEFQWPWPSLTKTNLPWPKS